MGTRNKTLNGMMAGLPLGVADAVRLCLELSEEAGELTAGMEREELMRFFRRIMRAGVAAVRTEEHTVSLEEAAWASVEARKGRREATKSDLRHFVRRMLRVEGVATRPLRAMTTQECRDLLQKGFGGSVHSYRKGRAILHSIFTFGFRREWCDSNPVDRIEVPPVVEKEIVPLTPEEVQRLEEVAARPEFADIRLPLHLMLYCGIRPAEVARLDPRRDINRRERTVTVRPLASKTGGGRVIPLRSVARRGLPRTLPHPKLSPKRWRHFRRAAGFRHWVPDVLRHTFATYHAAYFRNLAELQLEMGHRDTSLLRTRYVNAAHVTPKTAKQFWRGSYIRWYKQEEDVMKAR